MIEMFHPSLLPGGPVMQTEQRARSIKPLLAAFAIEAPDIVVEDLVLDSRDVAVHKAFIALNGHALDGRDFIPQAISLGAKVILAEADSAKEHGQMGMREQSLIIQFYQLPQCLSALATAFFSQPAQQLNVIAVTGTNGKTSTVQLTSQLAHLLGEKAASIGTLGAGIYHDQEPLLSLNSTLNTTPDAVSMQRLLADFVAHKATVVALEASSHALVQHRLSELKTDVAVFTNLSRDHLDYHLTMSAYAQAKRMLLSQPQLRFAVLNFDDQECQNWLAALPDGVLPVLFSLTGKPQSLVSTAKYLYATDIEYLPKGSRFKLCSSWGEANIELALLGHFNLANLLAAIAAQLCLGKSLPAIAAVCNKLTAIAGRMEVFHYAGKPAVVVDYAHTPDALQQTLVALRAHARGKLLCVFGCGGGRDQGKRSLMGGIAERYADQVIVTNDNSRHEDPLEIAQQILSGCVAPQRIDVELDRKKAIALAVAKAGVEDVILVAGKGHEDYQIIGGQSLPYNERQFVQDYLGGTQ
jgi:UDP-N-acetylmuramoyl-L-alanyl-D-glutamate--2,6-diaminopimelate ligase